MNRFFFFFVFCFFIWLFQSIKARNPIHLVAFFPYEWSGGLFRCDGTTGHRRWRHTQRPERRGVLGRDPQLPGHRSAFTVDHVEERARPRGHQKRYLLFDGWKHHRFNQMNRFYFHKIPVVRAITCTCCKIWPTVNCASIKSHVAIWALTSASHPMVISSTWFHKFIDQYRHVKLISIRLETKSGRIS